MSSIWPLKQCRIHNSNVLIYQNNSLQALFGRLFHRCVAFGSFWKPRNETCSIIYSNRNLVYSMNLALLATSCKNCANVQLQPSLLSAHAYVNFINFDCPDWYTIWRSLCLFTIFLNNGEHDQEAHQCSHQSFCPRCHIVSKSSLFSHVTSDVFAETTTIGAVIHSFFSNN